MTYYKIYLYSIYEKNKKVGFDMVDNDVIKIRKLKQEAYYNLFDLCNHTIENVLKQEFAKNNIDETMVTYKIVDVLSSFIINRLTIETNSSYQNRIEFNKIINSYLSDKLNKKVNIKVDCFLITDKIIKTKEYTRYKFLNNKLKNIQK